MSASLDNRFFNLNIERAILSSILYSPQDFEEITNGLEVECFYHPFHRDIYAIMLELQRSNLPIHEEFIRQRWKGEDFDDDLFFEILSTTPLPNTEPYVAELVRLAENRRVDQLCLQMRKILHTSGDAEEAKAFLIANIDKAYNADNEMLSFSQVKAKLRLQPPREKISVGVAFVDQHLSGGFDLGSFIMVGGRPNSGKTSLVIQWLKHVSKKEKVAFWSLEFLLEDIIDKQGGVNGSYENENWLLNDKTNSVDKLCADIGRLARQGIRFFVIDSQMKLKSRAARNREEEETHKFAMLSEVAHMHKCVVVLIYQTTVGGKAFYSSVAEYYANHMIEVEKCEDIMHEYAKEVMPLTERGQPKYDYRRLRYIKCKGNMEITWLYRFKLSNQTFEARLNEKKVQAAIKQWEKAKKEAEKNGRDYIAPRLSEQQLQEELDGYCSGAAMFEDFEAVHIKL